MNQSQSWTSSLCLNAKQMGVCVAACYFLRLHLWLLAVVLTPASTCTELVCQQLAGTASVFTRLHYKAQTAALHTVPRFCPRVKLPFHNFHYIWSWGEGGKKGFCDAPWDRGSCFSFAAYDDLHSDGLFQPRFSKKSSTTLVLRFHFYAWWRWWMTDITV